MSTPLERVREEYTGAPHPLHIAPRQIVVRLWPRLGDLDTVAAIFAEAEARSVRTGTTTYIVGLPDRRVVEPTSVQKQEYRMRRKARDRGEEYEEE